MIRVAFTIPTFDAKVWTGGLNYFRNLISAVLEQPDRRIEPVLFADPSEGRDRFVATLPGLTVLPYNDPLRSFATRIRSKIARTFSRADFQTQTWLRRLESEGIDLLSHAKPLPHGSRVRTLAWIPDFQHRRLPDFFSLEEREARDRQYQSFVEHCDGIVVSSQAAQKDFESFYPAAKGKAHVLRFVAGDPTLSLSETEFRAKYDLMAPYFALPNQFWKHKNHGLVLDAMDRLQRRGRRVVVISTGSTTDYRHPEYFDELMARVKVLGLGDSFRALGLVPSADVAALLRFSMALINPSYFEGWSTSVEEAKTFGKTTLLSNLPVHQEQAPQRAIYFHPDDAEALARAMEETVDGFEPQRESLEAERARAQWKVRRRRFAIEYQSIVESVCALGLSLKRASDGS